MARADNYLRIESDIGKSLSKIDSSSLKQGSKKNLLLTIQHYYAKSGGKSCSIPLQDILSRMNAYADTKKDEITKSGLYKLIARLTESKQVKKIDVPGTKTHVYELTALFGDDLTTKPVDITLTGNPQEYAKVARRQRDLFNETNSIMLMDIPHSNYAMRLMTGILQGFVRADRYDRRKFIPRTPRRISLRDSNDDIVTEEISVKTTARSDDESQLMEFSDSVIIAALNSMYVESIYRQKGPTPSPEDIPPTFVFDIFDLCELLGLSRGNRKHVVARLQRVRDTLFTLDMTNAPEFRKLFKFGNQDIVEYQFITEFGYATEEIIKEEDPINFGEYEENREHARNDLFSSVTYDNEKGVLVERVPRFYFIKFNSYHFKFLIENPQEHRFVYPLELFNTKTPALLSQAYSWARGFIGGRTEGQKPQKKVMTIEEYRNHIAPVTSREVFFKLFVRMIESFLVDRNLSYDKQGLNIANLLGYFIEVDHRKPVLAAYYKRYPAKRPRTRGPGSKMDAIVTIWRDTEDELVGDNSVHNQLLRQERFAI